MLAAGYNLRVVLMGPEQNISTFASFATVPETVDGKLRPWDGTGVGFGIRGSASPVVTMWFEQIIQTYRTKAETAPIMFNFTSSTALWAIMRNFPVPAEGCTGKEGRNLVSGGSVSCSVETYQGRWKFADCRMCRGLSWFAIFVRSDHMLGDGDDEVEMREMFVEVNWKGAWHR